MQKMIDVLFDTAEQHSTRLLTKVDEVRSRRNAVAKLCSTTRYSRITYAVERNFAARRQSVSRRLDSEQDRTKSEMVI